ncbi:MAG TPA: hypothetical protein VJV75_06150 [Candidatus Polarisedimenticolia bacterium]|nr:hypothetical protein [Candidatus Polarisedimenticolia bacterium]
MRIRVAGAIFGAVLAFGIADPGVRAQDGTIKVKIRSASVIHHSNDDTFDPEQDFYAINSIDYGPRYDTYEIGGHDSAAWSDQVNSKLVPGRNQRFFDFYFELWDKDNCCFGNVDDPFDISQQSGPAGPNAPGGIFIPLIPTGSFPHVSYDVCTGRMSVLGVNGSPSIPLGSYSATLNGENSAPGVQDTWGRLQFDVEQVPANWLPDDIAIRKVQIVQSIYGASRAIADKDTALVIEIASTHPFAISAPVSGQMTDGISTVADAKQVTIAGGSIAAPGITLVALFDGVNTAPFKPRKIQGVGTGKVSGSATVVYAEATSPNAPIQLQDCGQINNTGQATDLPLVKTTDRLTLFQRFDYEEDKNFMTVGQLNTMYNTEEPYRLASWPLASLNSSSTYYATVFDHGSDCLLCFEPFNTLLHYNGMAAQAGIDRMVLAVRDGWFDDNHFRHQFVGDNVVGHSLGWLAPRAVLAEGGHYGVSTHELGHTYNLSQHPCSNAAPPMGPGCYDEYAHHPWDGAPYEALGFDVSGLIYPAGMHVPPNPPWGNLNCPTSTPQARDICAPNFMDITPSDKFQNWIDQPTFDWLIDNALPMVDPPVVNVSGVIHLPNGQGDGTAAPLVQGAMQPFAYQFMGVQDMPDAPMSILGELFSGIGPFRVRLVTAAGVHDYRFQPRFFDDAGRPDLIGGFSINVPWDPTTMQIQLIGPSDARDTGCWNRLCPGDGIILDQHFVTPAPPSASDLRAGRDASAPPTPAGGTPAVPTIGPGHVAFVDWNAFDPDSPETRASLLLLPPSASGGPGGPGGTGTQLPIAIDIAGGNFHLPQEQLAGVPGLYGGRVLVTDGVNTTEVWSGALFNVCNLANGGVEICNGLDDNCDGTVDNAPLPGPEMVSLNPQPFPPAPGDGITMQWAPDPLAQSYDVVYGDLNVLSTGGGNFTNSVIACLAENQTATSINLIPTPPVGHAYWFEVRGNDCTGPGTYDSGEAAQVGLRDAEIDASRSACRP